MDASFEVRVRNRENPYELTEEEKQIVKDYKREKAKKLHPKRYGNWDLENPNRKLRKAEKAWLAIPEEERPKIGDVFKGKEIARFCERYGYPVSHEGRNLIMGYLEKGATLGPQAVADGKVGGRPKGSRSKLTKEMLCMIGDLKVSPAEFLAVAMNNEELSFKERAEAARTLVSIVYPKASSVELDIINEEAESMEDIESRIKGFIEDKLLEKE